MIQNLIPSNTLLAEIIPLKCLGFLTYQLSSHNVKVRSYLVSPTWTTGFYIAYLTNHLFPKVANTKEEHFQGKSLLLVISDWLPNLRVLSTHSDYHTPNTVAMTFMN